MNKYENFIGKVLDSRYKILELVGVGGMAFVLKAEDLVMNRVVAIKILNDQYNGDEEAEKRFINESKAVAMLSNKNIVGIYDVAIYPDIKYIVMEYLDGITLKEYFQKKGPLPWKEACSYMLQVLRALEHAHSKGVVHRDIKPQNLILLKSGEIKVTDFGIAKTPDMPSVTISDKAIGTVYYISPEQASGKATSFASDLYSVGIMLFEALTGTLPFVADNPITIAMMQINDVPQNPHEINHEIPVGLAQVILKAMKKKPEERFADAHSMLKAIDYVIKIPEVVFSEADQRNLFGEKSEYIDINMINTGEIEDYLPIPEKTADDESKKGKKSKKVHKKLRARIKENQNHSMFPIISGVFFAFLIVALSVGGYMLVKWLPLLFESDTSSDDFIVRELVGTEFNSELQTQLEKQNYYITTRDGYNPNYDFGVIILQDPASGPRHITGNVCRITLTINRFPNELTVPDVRYKSKSEAEKILKQFNLGVTFETKTDPYVNKDQVIGTYPAAGESVEAGRTITVYVCSGSGVTTAKIVPDLMNLDVKEAMKKLNDAYLSYEIVREDSSKPKNTVIAQSVEPYTSGLQAWTVIIITISRQSDEATVPNMFGDTLEAATQKLIDAGLVLGTVYQDTTSILPIGTVVLQSVLANQKVATNTAIDITISGRTAEYADKVPNVLGKDMYTAELLLKNAKYTVKFKYTVSDQPIDTVLSQSLQADTSGHLKGTEIVLEIAESQTTRTNVPDLFGLTRAEAEAKLAENHLFLGDITYNEQSVFTPGTVFEQSLSSGTEVEKRTYINVSISGAEPKIPN